MGPQFWCCQDLSWHMVGRAVPHLHKDGDNLKNVAEDSSRWGLLKTGMEKWACFVKGKHSCKYVKDGNKERGDELPGADVQARRNEFQMHQREVRWSSLWWAVRCCDSSPSWEVWRLPWSRGRRSFLCHLFWKKGLGSHVREMVWV